VKEKQNICKAKRDKNSTETNHQKANVRILICTLFVAENI